MTKFIVNADIIVEAEDKDKAFEAISMEGNLEILINHIDELEVQND